MNESGPLSLPAGAFGRQADRPLERGSQLAGYLVSGSVHLLAIAAFLWWGRPSPPPPPPPPEIIETQLVSLGALARKGTPAPEKLLPRLSNAPAPPPPEVVHLGDVEPKPDPELEKKKEEEEKRTKEKEEKERQRRMREALSAFDGPAGRADDPRRFRNDRELPGQADGSEAGWATKGRLQAAYLDLVGRALSDEWKVSFVSDEELRRLCGKVLITIDRGRFLRKYSWDRRSTNPEFNDSVEVALKRFTQDGDKRFPPFPDDGAFGDSVTYRYVFKKDERLVCP